MSTVSSSNLLNEQCLMKNFTKQYNFDMSKLNVCADDKVKNKCRS